MEPTISRWESSSVPTSVSEMTHYKYGRDKPYFYGLFLDSFSTCDRVAKHGSNKGKWYPELPVAIKRGERRTINLYAAIYDT